MDSFDQNRGSRGGASRPAERETLRLEEPDAIAAEEAREANSQDEAEARMRQALGLFGQRSSPVEHGPADRRPGGGGHMQVGARRHRFVQDGEVPVSVVRGRRDQQAASLAPALPRPPEGRDKLLDEQLADRSAREMAERKLADAQTVLKTLQTRLGHAELERDEAQEEARSLREQLATERMLTEERARPVPAEARRERVVAAPKVETVMQDAVASKEPEPVKWWL